MWRWCFCARTIRLWFEYSVHVYDNSRHFFYFLYSVWIPFGKFLATFMILVNFCENVKKLLKYFIHKFKFYAWIWANIFEIHNEQSNFWGLRSAWRKKFHNEKLICRRLNLGLLNELVIKFKLFIGGFIDFKSDFNFKFVLSFSKYQVKF